MIFIADLLRTHTSRKAAMQKNSDDQLPKPYKQLSLIFISFLLKQRLANLTSIRMSQRVTRQSSRMAGQTPPESKSSELSPSKEIQENKENQEVPADQAPPPPPPPPPPVPLDPLEISLFRREEQIKASIIHTAASLDLGPEWVSFQEQLLKSLENPAPEQNQETIQRDKQAAEQGEKKMGEQDGGHNKGNNSNQEIKDVILGKPIEKKRVHKVRWAHPSLQTDQILVQAESLEFQCPPPWNSIGGVYIKDVGVQVNLEQPQQLQVLDIYDEEGEEVIKVRYRDREFLCLRAYMEQRHIRALIDFYEELMYTQHVVPKQKKKKRKEKEKEKEKDANETAKADEQKLETDPRENSTANNKKTAPLEPERPKPSKAAQLVEKRRSVRQEQLSDSRSKDSKKKKH